MLGIMHFLLVEQIHIFKRDEEYFRNRKSDGLSPNLDVTNTISHIPDSDNKYCLSYSHALKVIIIQLNTILIQNNLWKLAVTL